MNNNFDQVPGELVEKLKNFKAGRPLKIMEVCGTHTVEIHRWGIHNLLPAEVKLVSGPGCPVCVTPSYYIDQAIHLLQQDFIIATFGDLVKVPGNHSTLEKEKAAGGLVKVVYSPMEVINYARNTGKQVVFLAVGFETTSPGIAFTIHQCSELGINNIKFFCAAKIIKPAMEIIIRNSEIDGFLLPGHVSTIIGSQSFNFLAENNIPGVVAGFKPLDLVSSILQLLSSIKSGNNQIINNYSRAVNQAGNRKAQMMIEQVFEPGNSEWRGLGNIDHSGLKINQKYRSNDVEYSIDLNIPREEVNTGCRCGDVLKGYIDPPQCPLFKKQCNPDNPIGPCMVSKEGSCSAWYWYG
ncbi:MAG: hydrogenase formation protein HypD [bacterium]